MIVARPTGIVAGAWCGSMRVVVPGTRVIAPGTRVIAPGGRVVVLEGAKEPIILVCTELSLSALQLIEIYGARFSIELTIRDLKQHFGLGDYQCTTTLAILRFVHLACVAFCLWRLALIENLQRDDLNLIDFVVAPKLCKRVVFVPGIQIGKQRLHRPDIK